MTDKQLDELAVRLSKLLQERLHKHKPKWAVSWTRREWHVIFRCRIAGREYVLPSLDLSETIMLLELKDLTDFYADEVISQWKKDRG